MVLTANIPISLEVLLIIFTIASTSAAAGFIIGFQIGKAQKK